MIQIEFCVVMQFITVSHMSNEVNADKLAGHVMITAVCYLMEELPIPMERPLYCLDCGDLNLFLCYSG